MPGTFRLRRAKLKFAGEIVPTSRWTVMVDPAETLSLSTKRTEIDGTAIVTEGTLRAARGSSAPSSATESRPAHS